MHFAQRPRRQLLRPTIAQRSRCVANFAPVLVLPNSYLEAGLAAKPGAAAPAAAHQPVARAAVGCEKRKRKEHHTSETTHKDTFEHHDRNACLPRPALPSLSPGRCRGVEFPPPRTAFGLRCRGALLKCLESRRSHDGPDRNDLCGARKDQARSLFVHRPARARSTHPETRARRTAARRPAIAPPSRARSLARFATSRAFRHRPRVVPRRLA